MPIDITNVKYKSVDYSFRAKCNRSLTSLYKQGKYLRFTRTPTSDNYNLLFKPEVACSHDSLSLNTVRFEFESRFVRVYVE